MKDKELFKSQLRMNLQHFSEGEEGSQDGVETTQSENTDSSVGDITIDMFKEFAETNPDARAFIQQSTQAKIDKGVQTMFANKKDELLAEARIEASNMSPEQKELAKLRQDMESIKRDKAIADNRSLVLQELDDISLDDGVRPYVRQMALDLVDTDPKKTSDMLSNLSTVIDKITETTSRQSTYNSVNQLNQIRENVQPSQQAEQPKRDVLDPNSYGKEAIGRAIFGK